jgi:hypothetical protein
VRAGTDVVIFRTRGKGSGCPDWANFCHFGIVFALGIFL